MVRLLTERYEPEEGVVSEDSVEVLAVTTVVGLFRVEGVVVLTALLAELNGGELAGDKVEVEDEEASDDEGKHTGQDVRCHHKVGDFVIKGIGVAHSSSQDRVACCHNQEGGHRAVEEHVHEEFVVVEADTVGHPWAVMVHLKNTSVALRAVMASVWLRFVAPLANANTTVALAFH